MKRFALIICCCVTVFGGCASDPTPPTTLEVPEQQLSPPPPDKAQIVFLQPFKPLTGTQLTAIYEINGANKELLGVVSSKTKIVELVVPGQHLFMSNGVTASFLRANVEAGKRYYVLSRFIGYIGYQLRPIRKGGPSDYNATIPEFQVWLRELPLVTATPAGVAFFTERQTIFDKIQATGWESWQRKTVDEQTQLTLNPDDDIAQ